MTIVRLLRDILLPSFLGSETQSGHAAIGGISAAPLSWSGANLSPIFDRCATPRPVPSPTMQPAKHTFALVMSKA